MSPIDEAIEAIELRKEGASFSYREVAKKFGVDRTTLSRRHKGKTRSYAGMAQQQQLLSPQQETELVKYIERYTERGLPRTREIIQNFASAVAKWEVSDSWITRFLHRHSDSLTTKWSAAIDHDRHKADDGNKYKAYFDLLHSKMKEYNIQARDTYNMDEKGFFVGRTTRAKRTFSKAYLAQKRRTAALQDGNRKWVTLLACVCASATHCRPLSSIKAQLAYSRAGLTISWPNSTRFSSGTRRRDGLITT